MVAASGLAPPRAAAPCPRTRGGLRPGFLRFVPPVAPPPQQLRCCASTVDDSVVCAAASKPRLPRVVGMGSKLVGCGSAIPTLSISNDDLSKIVETSDEWIAARTGIRNRRVLSGDETLRGLSIQAAQRALEMAQVKADDVDLVLLCTSTPDDLFGGAAQVLTEVGCTNAFGFDITAACSGFIVGLITATRFIKGGGVRNVLVVGADALSKFVDWTDRGTCILFGDAAGAVLVQACSADEDGLLGFCIQSDGNGQKHLNAGTLNVESILFNTNGVPGFPPKKATYSCIQMNGKEVFRFAVRFVPQSIEKALEEAGLPASSIDWLLLHQANQRIIDAAASRLDIPSDKVISNLANYGNTSAASIPLALDEAVRSGKVKTGDTIAASGFGAGLTWGSAIVKWG
ncbi:beta-ketoacyl-[acyl-carrier-protein] synthase III, chloroplastic-like [Phragmites australis]|uniref:beta-ketoacyl-[acyl-carrier-protein] synthase III, chloroplastic-like n=1 Tax=Phragmites australis TaxID=29695 RepID=UPI002D78DAD1|nr:beta-ketoacyl-[acyl-carrier-protein] synthase III, chloroplastic-like [Phragmites australis]